MRKKIMSLFAIVIMIFVSTASYGFAEEKGKVIFIDMNRTNLGSMMNIPILKNEIEKRGYVALMNIRGDQGTDDRRSCASMGAGTRASVTTEDYINFQKVDQDTAKAFEVATGQKAKEINDLGINRSINENLEYGEYGANLGSLGKTLSENGLKTSVIGNADIIENNQLVKNRNLCLVAMDQYGRIDSGNIDNINKKDSKMPFGISTDYDKLLDETKKSYKNSDAIFVELGDTYRLDMYRLNLNDNVYIASAFPSDLDYKNKRRLSPIIKFSGEGKGLLESATTRKAGIVANLDVGVDILGTFGLENKEMVGRSYTLVNKEDNISYLKSLYERIVSISSIRSTIINGFVGVISASWVIAMFAIFFRNYMPHKERVFKVLKEFIKLGIIMPLSFMLAPLMNFKTPISISLGIFATTLILYLLGRKLFKDNDIKHMGFFATLTILVIVIDSVFGTYLMQNNIMSYDAVIGARYYGVGNEYEGVTIASAVFGLAVLLHYKKVSKLLVVIFSLIILITSAYPSMGANVGGAISECVAYLLFIMLIYDIKIDFKKAVLLAVSAVVVVFAFAALDILSGSESHLGMFVQRIFLNGPGEILQTFGRKIQMNMQLAQTSVWVNILLVGIGVIAVLIFKPSRHFRKIMNNFPILFKGFIASMVGCIITLLVNDSGIVAASTASIYILIPLIIISINMIIFEKNN